MNIKAKVTLTLDVGLQVGHFKVIIYPVYDKIREPRILTTNLEELIK